jgi:hypothetical protein
MEWLTNVANWIFKNPFWPLVTLGLTLFGLYHKFVTTRVRKPRFAFLNRNIVRNQVGQFPAIQMLHNGNAIPDLTASRFAFWNAGRETIRRADLVAGEPLMIRLSANNSILECSIVQSPVHANNFAIAIAPDQRSVVVSFDYLDFNEGVVLQILHTGRTDEDIKLSGRVMGAGIPRGVSVDSASLVFTRMCGGRTRIPKMIWFMVFVIPVLILLLTLSPAYETLNSRTANLTVCVLLFIFTWSTGIYVAWRRIPRKLDAFFDL